MKTRLSIVGTMGGLLVAALALLLTACGGGGDGGGNDAGATFEVERVFSQLGFSQITDIQSQPYPVAAGPGGDRLFVLERAGRIRVLDNEPGTASSTVFLDIRDRVTDAGSEQGLLGLAFHPDFENNGFFYVHYTVDTNSVPQRIRIARFAVLDQAGAPNTADAASEQIVLIVDQAAEGPPATNHNGGALAFSPANGLLHIAVGDGGGGNDPNGNGQDLGTLSGSILRIDVDNTEGAMNYAIPADNPFVGDSGARGEIFAYGLRNPFKLSFDGNGDLWIGDVGQNAREEVDFLAAGDTTGPNYGWDCREGSLAGGGPDAACDGLGPADFVDPVDEYSQDGSQSITGGFVYRGSALPSLVGRYVYGDFISGRIWAYDPATGGTESLADSDLGISSFGRDAAGEVYVGDFFDGGLYRLVADPS